MIFNTSLYIQLLIFVNNFLIFIRAGLRKILREGREFKNIKNEILNTQWLNGADLNTFIEEQLKIILLHAVEHSAFYRDLNIRETVLSQTSTVALGAFPLIDKQIVRNNGMRLIAQNARRPLFKGSTSGTTGAPLTLFQDLRAINRENAFIWRQLEWAGLKRGERRAWIRGDLIVPSDVDFPPFWRMNYADNMLMFSSYHLSDQNAPIYISELERFDPVVIQAYPSSISFLAKWLDAKGMFYAGSSLKGIVTSSETLDGVCKMLIETRFGCRVFDWYGQFERVAAIGTCEYGRQHIISDYSFVELLPAGDDLYEIVGTGFNNFAMPLIRYRTGDYVRLDDATRQCDCGRRFPLVASIQGRADDVVKLPDGRQVGRLTMIYHGVEGILEAQIRQDEINRIDILVVPTHDYSTTIESKILANARKRLGSSVEISVEMVSAIPRTKNGKKRAVVCNV